MPLPTAAALGQGIADDLGCGDDARSVAAWTKIATRILDAAKAATVVPTEGPPAPLIAGPYPVTGTGKLE